MHPKNIIIMLAVNYASKENNIMIPVNYAYKEYNIMIPVNYASKEYNNNDTRELCIQRI